MVLTAKRLLIALMLAASAHSNAAAADEKWLPPLVLDGEVGDGLWLYGQINKGLLVANDGGKTLGYPLVDNSNSSTRAGIWFKTALDEEFTFSANLEYEWNPYATGRVNRLNREDVDWDQHRMRKAEGILASPYGTLWLGQGSSASDGSSESDLSGTTLVAYSSVGDSAGGQLFTTSAGAVSGVSVFSTFRNLDGLGRLTRIRYDTPEFGGFTLKASTGIYAAEGGDDANWDLAGTYRASLDEFEVQAAIGFARPSGDFNRFSGSASILHKSTGLNATFAMGTEGLDKRDPVFVYGKLGWRPVLTGIGSTAFAIDLYSGDNIASAGSDSLSVGLGAVQTLDYYNTDLYLTLRWYQHDDSTASYEPVSTVLTGLRFRF